MELMLKNFSYVTYGMGFMFFFVYCCKLYRQKNDNPILKFLFFEFVFMLFVYFRSLFFTYEPIRQSDLFLKTNNSIDLFILPLTVAFIAKILLPDRLTKKTIFLMHLPTAIFSSAYLITLSDVAFSVMIGYAIVFSILSSIFLFYLSLKYDFFVKNQLSMIDSFHVRWIRNGIFFLFAFFLVWVLTGFINGWISLILYNLSAILIWYFLYYHSANHQRVKEMPDLLSQLTERTISTQDKYPFVERLTQILMNEKAYLIPSLSISELANQIGTNRTYLSDYLNNSLSTNFYDYINTFRIDAACSLLKETNLSLEQISEKSGFNSLSTFRRCFVKQVGCTPNQFRKKL